MSDAGPVEAAHEAGLIYTSDSEPGIRRVRNGRNFTYLDADGRSVRDRASLDRIKSLAVPRHGRTCGYVHGPADISRRPDAMNEAASSSGITRGGVKRGTRTSTRGWSGSRTPCRGSGLESRATFASKACPARR